MITLQKHHLAFKTHFKLTASKWDSVLWSVALKCNVFFEITDTVSPRLETRRPYRVFSSKATHSDGQPACLEGAMNAERVSVWYFMFSEVLNYQDMFTLNMFSLQGCPVLMLIQCTNVPHYTVFVRPFGQRHCLAFFPNTFDCTVPDLWNTPNPGDQQQVQQVCLTSQKIRTAVLENHISALINSALRSGKIYLGRCLLFYGEEQISGGIHDANELLILFQPITNLKKSQKSLET